MARNLTGGYAPPSNSFTNPIDGTAPYAADGVAFFSDNATEMTDSLSRSGKGEMLADLDHGGFKAINQANGTDPQDGATLAQLTSATILKPVLNAKTGAYTVVSSDMGSTLALGGAAYYTLTFGAVVGYAVGYYAVTNTDTGRAKKIVLTGGQPYLLWPGQSDIISNVSGAWVPLKGPTRYVLPGTTAIYVDKANGNDANDGFAPTTGAFKTFQAAWKNLIKNFDMNGQFAAFYLAASQTFDSTFVSSGSTYSDFDMRDAPTGGGQVIIDGNGNAVIWPTTGNAHDYAGPAGMVTFRNVIFASTTGGNLVMSYPGTLNTGAGCYFSTCLTYHVLASGSGSVLSLNANYTVAGSCTAVLAATQGGFLVDSATTITIGANMTCSNAYALADRVSNLQVGWAGPQTFSLGAFTVTGKRHSVSTNAVVSGTAAAANYFPGTSAGTTASGGLFT